MKMSAKRLTGLTRRDLIIEVWEALDCESVGARELEQIQVALQERFGAGALISPATIARIVADEGASLRHPEVFDCDLKWRERRMAARSFAETLDFSDLQAAFASVVKLEEQRLAPAGGGAVKLRAELRKLVVALRQDLLLRAKSKVLPPSEREVAKEASHWLAIWLQSPELFSDWLDLRRRAPEFCSKFPAADGP
jgi:hypothetical protein